MASYDVWRAVILRRVAERTGATRPCREWEDTIAWLKSQPETAAHLMQQSRPQPRHWRGLVVFDALDRITPAWQ
jgi:hypothetical protein